MAYLYVFVGGGFGAILRYLLSKLSYGKLGLSFGTLLANILACLIAAIVIYWFKTKVNEIPLWLKQLLLIGFCGGLSTFSTFSVETALLFKENQFIVAIINILLSLSIGIGLIFVALSDK